MHAVHLLVVATLSSLSTVGRVGAQDLLNLVGLLQPTSAPQADYSRNAQNVYRSSIDTLAQSLRPPATRSSNQGSGINNFRDFISELSARTRQQQPFQQQLLDGSKSFEQFVRTLFGPRASSQTTTFPPADFAKDTSPVSSPDPASVSVTA